MDIDQIPAKLEELSKKILDCREDAGWQIVKRNEKDQYTIYSKPSTAFDGRIFKAEGIIEASPETCFRHSNPKPESTRSQWDSTIKAMEIVKMIKADQWPEAYILRTIAHGAMMGVISGRDFVDIIINVNNDDMMGTMAESVTTELCPPCKDYVRGINHYCCILSFRVPGEPNKTKLLYIVQSDIGGRLPRSIVESAVPSAISGFFADLKKQIKKERSS